MISNYYSPHKYNALVSLVRNSPAIYPALGQALDKVLSSRLSGNSVSFRTVSVPEIRQPQAVDVLPTIAPASSLFRDLDDYFFKTPFLTASDVLSFMRDWDIVDGVKKKHFFPGYDISSAEENVKVFIDLPGVKMDDISIEIEDDKVLRVRGERKSNKDGSKSEMKFEKSFSFDKTIDPTKIVANLTDGVLTITAPKVPDKEPPKSVRKIDIKTGSQELEC